MSTNQWRGKGGALKRGRGIEWCDITNNPIGGCKHACRWTMPDGNEAICYAEDIAENGFARSAYKEGFDHHYWRPHMLKKLKNLDTPHLVFINSMSDLFGHWVPEEHVQLVLDTMRECPQHTFQALTKNAPGILKWVDQLPQNLWVGVSSPPDSMWGRPLSRSQQSRMLARQLDVFDQLPENTVRWMSIEPLSWDIHELLVGKRLDWAVIGAATDGKKKFQPDPNHVQSLLDLFDVQGTPVFFKGNLDWPYRLEDFPVVEGWDQAVQERQRNAIKYGWTQNRLLNGRWTSRQNEIKAIVEEANPSPGQLKLFL